MILWTHHFDTVLVERVTPKGHFEINWPLALLCNLIFYKVIKNSECLFLDKNYTNFGCQSVYKPFKLSKPQKCNHLNFHAQFRAFHFERRSSFEKFILQLVNLFLLCLSRFRCVAGYSARFNDANSSDIRCRLWTTSTAAKFKNISIKKSLGNKFGHTEE